MLSEIYANPFFCIFGAPFGLHFESILEALGALLTPRGCPGVVLEGSEKEVEKRGPPISYKSHGSGGGVPIRTMSRESSGQGLGLRRGLGLGRGLGRVLGSEPEDCEDRD